MSGLTYFGKAKTGLVLTSGVDNIAGTVNNDSIKGISANLQSTDVINGGAGTDTLVFTNLNINLTSDKFAGVNSVEQLDVTAGTTGVFVQVDAHMIAQAGGTLTILGGANAVSIDDAGAAGAGNVVVMTTGLITLRNASGEFVTVSNKVNGNVLGGVGGDTINGGLGLDTLTGGTGDDVISGGGAADTLVGGDGNDVLSGGVGSNTVDGGNGFDYIFTTGADVLTGGSGSDTFAIGAIATNTTITDFAASDPLEVIDLRAVTTVHGMADLTITDKADGAHVDFGTHHLILTGVKASNLTAQDFLFAGSTVVTAAQALTTPWIATMTGGADNYSGTTNADVFLLAGSIGNLSSADQINGGGGVDTLRVVNPGAAMNFSQFAGFKSIEVLDLQASSGAGGGAIALSLDAHSVLQSGNDTLTVVTGNNALLLNDSDVGGAGTVIIQGFGLVTLQNDTADQAVTISDQCNGWVLGGVQVDTLTGGAGNDTLSGGDNNDIISGGGGDDILDGGAGNDSMNGGSGDDRMSGGDGRDVMIDGAGNDKLDGGLGADTLYGGNGRDVLTGGGDGDTFVIDNASGSATITDFEVHNLLERIDLRAVATATGMSALTISQVGANTQIVVGTETITLQGVSASDLTADNFYFAGNVAPTTYHVAAGTAEDVIQALIEGAPDGSTIILDPGTFTFDHTLNIDRSNISFHGSGVGQTTIVSTISDANASPVINVESTVGRQQVAGVSANAAAGSTTITVSDVSNIHPGDVIYIAEPNDAAMFAAMGDTGITLPADYATNPQLYWLRECLVKVTAVNGNTLTLSNPLPYDFQGNYAFVQKDTPLTNVDVGGFTIQASSGTPDPTDFTNVHPAWSSIATVSVELVTGSNFHDMNIVNSQSMGISFRHDYGVTADNINITGTWNKGEEGNGIGLNLNEVFASTFTNMTIMDMRHSVEFSPWSAEHYNWIQIDNTNRDINFHGSPDSMNTVIIDHDQMSFAPGGMNWPAVGAGVFPIHPKSTIDANTVVFGYLDGSSQIDIVHGWDKGAYLNGEGGDDTLIGGAGADTIVPGQGNDTVTGGAGPDLFLRGFGGNGDVITDFQAGAGGDTLVLTGYAFKSFSDLVLKASGANTIVDLGQDGSVTLQGVAPSALTAANFQFAADGGPGLAITYFGTPSYMLGSDGADTFTLPQASLSTMPLKVLGGDGFDAVKVGITGFSGSLATFSANWKGVDALLLPNTTNLALTFDQHIFDQADNHTFTLILNSGMAATLTVGNPTNGGALYIDGAANVHLTSTLSNTIHVTDTAGATVTGGNLTDVLYGGAKADVLNGFTGDDTVIGGGGADTLTGATGNDVFVFNSISDSSVTAHDLITDLETGLDKIDLHSIDADTTLAGDQAFHLVSAFGHHAGELMLSYSAANNLTTISGDVNGDGVADFAIDATGDHHLFTGFVL